MILGKCPKCNSNIEIRKKEIQGKKVELYVCENAKWKTEDGEFFELTKDSTCNFRIWQNALKQFGYYLKHSDIKSLLKHETVIANLKRNKKEFKKYICLDLEYGVSILFDEEVEE